MIVFDLSCQSGHRFEGWFASSDDFERQLAKGMVGCPHCGSQQVAKAPMAPAVPRKGNQQVERANPQVANQPMPPEVVEAFQKLAQAQAESLKTSTWVGGQFAEESRAMFYGEKDKAAIHGEVSAEEARDLLEEGVPVAPLLFPVAPPEELN